MIIAVGGFKGGTGKSSVATGLAVALESRGLDVFLVDADPVGSRTASAWLAQRRLWRKTEGDPGRIAGAQLSGELDAEVTDLAGRYGAVVVDVGGRDSDEMRAALLAAAVFIAPFQPSQGDLWTAEDVVGLVRRAKRFNKGLVGWCVLVRTSTNPKVNSAGEAAGFLRDVGGDVLRLAEAQLRDRTAYRTAILEGRSVLELADPKARDELADLAAEVLP